MKQQFELGQDVEVEYRVTQHGKDTWRRGKIVNVDLSEENVYWVDVSDNTEHFEITRHADDIRPIQSDPTPQPAAVIQYPPLRVMIDGVPSQTWVQLLRLSPAVASQPHLYLLGQYELVTISMMEHFKSAFIVLECVPLPDITVYYRVFIITEGV